MAKATAKKLILFFAPSVSNAHPIHVYACKDGIVDLRRRIFWYVSSAKSPPLTTAGPK